MIKENNQENHLIKKIKVQTMKPYPKYKDSGVEWIGEVPTHWLNLTLKRITNMHRQGYYTTESYIDNGVKLIRISDLDENGNINYKNMPFVKISDKDEIVYQVKNGDFLFPRTGSIGLFGYVIEVERAVFASYLINFRFNQEVVYDFLKYFFFSDSFKNGIFSDLHGGVNQNVHAENIKNQIITFPPIIVEQVQIASYLDHKTSQIDTLIEKKKRLIELLKEERTAVINQAVTKGLDPNVKMKDSGIEWLGEIPEHWYKIRFKYALVIKNQKDQEQNRNNSLKKIALEHIESWTGRLLTQKETVFEGDGVLFDLDDILFGKLRPYLAKVWQANFSGSAVGDFFVFKPQNFVNSKYAFYRIISREYIDVISGSTFGAKMPRVSWDFISNLPFPVPPIEEQLQIVSHIDHETSRIDTIISKTEKQIELLQEYRTALISEVVTGKIDIRNWNEQSTQN
ncbi:MAG: restriction endonuclease subunit S [Desulfobacterales bacterium]|nr:restriction endonuclease subunit S [Desulfobacterales bacterium]